MKDTIDLGGVSREFGRYALEVQSDGDAERPYPYRITMRRTLPTGHQETLTCDIGPQTMQELILTLTKAYMGHGEGSQ